MKIIPILGNAYQVYSAPHHAPKQHIHTVEREKKNFICDCPTFREKHSCPHVEVVKSFLGLNNDR